MNRFAASGNCCEVLCPFQDLKTNKQQTCFSVPLPQGSHSPLRSHGHTQPFWEKSGQSLLKVTATVLHSPMTSLPRTHNGNVGRDRVFPMVLPDQASLDVSHHKSIQQAETHSKHNKRHAAPTEHSVTGQATHLSLANLIFSLRAQGTDESIRNTKFK